MAEYKKSFILYADLISVVKKLVERDRQNNTNYAGELFLHILEYVNDNNPIPIDFIVEMAFEPIKLQLKRDLIKWIDFREKQSFNGKKGGRPKKDMDNLDNEINPKNPTLLNETQKSLNATVNANVTVNDINVDYYVVNGEIKKGNVVDWYLKTHQPNYEALLMQLQLSKFDLQIKEKLREYFINGFSFNDYKHIQNSFKKHITELKPNFIKVKPKLVR